MCSKPGGLGSQTHFLMTPEISWSTGQWPRSAQLGAAMEKRTVPGAVPGGRRFASSKAAILTHNIQSWGRRARRADPGTPPTRPQAVGDRAQGWGQEAGDSYTSLHKLEPVHLLFGLSFSICNIRRIPLSFCTPRQADPCPKAK